ncbi:DUF6056 family protein [Brucella anthropi]|uniref:Uncharacterized protein n=1 Tax=Brucella anthropi TaxID=529 RepID=A0A6L3YYW6_BRUAN|nr:DUF6056 family protein [Brucella anthropi]KAB2725359.1 hypothetical protein F9K90_23475 [Brucella anthropi]KAB2757556.1 hypothetical protein F9L04_24920 [Brucella anthropi]
MNANNKTLSSWLLYSSVLLVFITIACKLRLMPYADDVTFSHALDNVKIVDYLIHRYKMWSGRVVIEAIMVSTITIHAFWKIMIPVCLILSSYLLWSITLKERVPCKVGMPLVIFSLLLINAPVAGDAQWWVTGFYNYLLPSTCALFLLNELLSFSQKKSIFIISVLLSIIATSSEQVALFLIISIPFIYFIDRSKRSSNIALSSAYVVVLMGSAVTLLSPGSTARFSVEAARYMPQILDMSIFQKTIIGVDRLVENISYNRNICFIFSVVSFLSFLIKKGRVDFLSKMSVIFSVSALIFSLTSLSFYMRDINYITYYGKFYSVDFGAMKVYGCYLFYLITLMVMAAGSIESASGERDFRSFVVLLTGCLVTIAIGLSPTAYASGERVLYVFNISLIGYSFFNIRRIV